MYRVQRETGGDEVDEVNEYIAGGLAEEERHVTIVHKRFQMRLIG